jgi:signal transduction histidine kinase
MLQEDQLYLVLRGTCLALFDKHSVWFGRDSGTVPDYRIAPSGCQICRLAKSDSQVARRCARFYATLEEGDAVCPFGITVRKQLFDIGTEPKAALFLQTGVDADQLKNAIQQLPRNSKKKAKSSVDGNPPSQARLACKDQLEFFETAVRSVALSRVAFAIRAVSHDVLTPVQGAGADVELLSSLVSHVSDPKVSEVLDRLRGNLATTSRLAKKIGILLSPKQWFDKNRYRDVTVHAMLKNLAERLEPICGKRDVTIHVGYNAGRKKVAAIPDLFELVLGNLLENSVKYAFANTTVSIEFQQEKDTLRISFKNLGVKIDFDEIENRLIFQLGYRGRHSEDRQRLGTGSGLFVTKQIVDGHGGMIEVLSIPQDSQTDTPIACNVFTLIWPIYKN